MDDELLAVVDMLLRYGANVAIQNSEGETPLHLASAKSNPRLVEMLLKWGSCSPGHINIRNYKGETALIYAYRAGCEQCAKLLFVAGAEEDADELYGESARNAEETNPPPHMESIQAYYQASSAMKAVTEPDFSVEYK